MKDNLIRQESIIALGIFICLTVLLFFPFFTKSLLPFPGNFLLAWFEPWRSDYWQGAITLPHKPVASDVFRQLYPFKALAMEMFKEGRSPLWNPYNGAGMPLLATMHPGFLNPFNLFFFFLSPPLAWSLLIVIQPLLLAILFFLYARHLGLSFRGALFGGLVFTTSGFGVVKSVYGDNLYVLMWLPLLLLLIDKTLKDKKWPFLAIPLCLFLVLGSGHPQIAIYVLGMGGGYALFGFGNLWFKKRARQEFLKSALILTGAFLLGFGLSAIQLLPTYQLWQDSALGRETSFFIFKRFLVPFSHLVTLFIPNFFGNPGTYNFWGPADYVETVLYIGSGAFLFALLGIVYWLAKRKDWRKWYFTLVILMTFLISVHSPFSRFVTGLPLPFLSTSIPTRIFGLLTFILALLAGWGLDAWLKTKEIFTRTTKNILILMWFVWGGIFGFVLWHYLRGTPCPLLCWRVALRNSVFAFGVFLITFMAFVGGSFWPKSKKLLFLLILVVTVFSNLYLAYKFLPLSPKESFYPDNEIIIALKNLQKDKTYRFWSTGEGKIKTNLATVLKTYSPEYYEPLYNRRYGEFVSFINSGEPGLFKRSDVEIIDEINSIETNKRRERGLDFLSVKYILGKNESLAFPAQKEDNQEKKKNFCRKEIWENDLWYLCERGPSLPRAFLVGKYEIIAEKKDYS